MIYTARSSLSRRSRSATTWTVPAPTIALGVALDPASATQWDHVTRSDTARGPMIFVVGLVTYGLRRLVE